MPNKNWERLSTPKESIQIEKRPVAQPEQSSEYHRNVQREELLLREKNKKLLEELREHRLTQKNEAEDLLQTVFKLEPGGVAVVAGPDLVYQMATQSYRELTPDPDIELVGKTWKEIWSCDSNAEAEALLHRVLESGETITASQHRRWFPGGKKRYYSFSLARILWQGEPAVLIVLIDTTQLVKTKRRAEGAASKAARAAVELEAIFNGISDAVIFYDAQGKPRRANPAAVQAYGFNPVGKSREDIRRALSLSDHNGKVLELEELPSSRALAGEVIREERLTLTRSDGEVRHIMVSATPLTNEHGERSGAVLSWKDITAMQAAIRAQEQLILENQRQRDLMARIISETPAAIAFLTGPEHRYSLINEKFKELTRYSGNIIGLRVVDIIPESEEILVPLLNDVYETGKTHSGLDLGIPVKEGKNRLVTRYFTYSLIPVEDRQREIEGIMLTMFETTEAVVTRKRLEAERDKLRESEERFRHLANAMPQLVFTATPAGDIDYINKRYQEFDSIHQKEDGTWKITHTFHPDDVDGAVAAWEEAIRTGEFYQYEHRIRMSNGVYRWHLSRAVPVYGSDGAVIKWYGTSTNIDTQKQVERNLEEYARRLKRSNEELENFAFLASHDLQEPLRKIKSFGDRVVKKLGNQTDEETQDFLGRMMDASKRMQDMIQALLNLSRINTRGKPFELVDLNQLVPEVVSDLDERLRESQGKVHIGDLPNISADPVQIRQLFLNLIGNAIKYHKPGIPPVIKIMSAPDECDTAAEKRCIKIIVEDNGIGFAAEYAERIFQPFQRLVGRSEYEGTGIGLTICEKIVERHGGWIDVESRPGVGSKFIVVLPMR